MLTQQQQLFYFEKWVSYRFKNPVLNRFNGVVTAFVYGVLVVAPGTPGYGNDEVNLLVAMPGCEPDFIRTVDVEIVRLAFTLPEPSESFQ